MNTMNIETLYDYPLMENQLTIIQDQKQYIKEEGSSEPSEACSARRRN